jgi:hypothetical protein
MLKYSFSRTLIIIKIHLFLLLNRGSSRNTDDFEEDSNRLLCRFVVDGTGKRIGESIGIDNDILIVKSGSRLLGIPLKHIEEHDTMLLVKGLVDLKKAYELGEQWRNDSAGAVLEDVEIGEEDNGF